MLMHAVFNFPTLLYKDVLIMSFHPKRKNQHGTPEQKKNPMVCRCMSSFKREHVSVQAVSFSGYHHPLHPSLGVRGCCRGTWRGLKRWSFQGSPKETQPFWESTQVTFDEAVTELGFWSINSMKPNKNLSWLVLSDERSWAIGDHVPY